MKEKQVSEKLDKSKCLNFQGVKKKELWAE